MFIVAKSSATAFYSITAGYSKLSCGPAEMCGKTPAGYNRSRMRLTIKKRPADVRFPFLIIATCTLC